MALFLRHSVGDDQNAHVPDAAAAIVFACAKGRQLNVTAYGLLVSFSFMFY